MRNTQKWHAYLVSKGVECLSAPEQSPRGHWFFFAKDIDGNLIEMIDLRHMYYVLKWLGPLGGWIFRRGMYKRYYAPSPMRCRPRERSFGLRLDRDHGVVVRLERLGIEAVGRRAARCLRASALRGCPA